MVEDQREQVERRLGSGRVPSPSIRELQSTMTTYTPSRARLTFLHQTIQSLRDCHGRRNVHPCSDRRHVRRGSRPELRDPRVVWSEPTLSLLRTECVCPGVVAESNSSAYNGLKATDITRAVGQDGYPCLIRRTQLELSPNRSAREVQER